MLECAQLVFANLCYFSTFEIGEGRFQEHFKLQKEDDHQTSFPRNDSYLESNCNRGLLRPYALTFTRQLRLLYRFNNVPLSLPELVHFISCEVYHLNLIQSALTERLFHCGISLY